MFDIYHLWTNLCLIEAQNQRGWNECEIIAFTENLSLREHIKVRIHY